MISENDIPSYNTQQSSEDTDICDFLMTQINIHIPQAEAKVRHGHPVWFIEGNPIVGYNKQKA